MSNEEIEFEEICNKVCGSLPEGYTMKVCLENGAGWVEVEGPDCENILPVGFGVDSAMTDQVNEAIDAALYHSRNSDIEF